MIKFRVLKAEMSKRDITLRNLADGTGIRYQTLSNKLNGRSPLTFKEAVLIYRVIPTDLSMEELFEAEEMIDG